MSGQNGGSQLGYEGYRAPYLQQGVWPISPNQQYGYNLNRGIVNQPPNVPNQQYYNPSIPKINNGIN